MDIFDRADFSRAAATDSKELRGDAPANLVIALDALAYAKNLTRTAYINKVLSAHVDVALYESSVVHAMLRDNPLLPRRNRRSTDSAGYAGDEQ